MSIIDFHRLDTPVAEDFLLYYGQQVSHKPKSPSKFIHLVQYKTVF